VGIWEGFRIGRMNGWISIFALRALGGLGLHDLVFGGDGAQGNGISMLARCGIFPNTGDEEMERRGSWVVFSLRHTTD